MKFVNILLVPFAWAAMVLVTMLPAQQVVEEAPAATSSGFTIGVGPNRTVLPTGTYRFIFIPDDAGVETTTTTVVVGGDQPQPPPPPPPPPDDVRGRVRAALDGVVDESKAQLLEAFALSFEQLISSVDDGAITEQARLALAAKMSVELLTIVNPEPWQPFIEVLDDVLGNCASLTVCVSTLGVVVEELKVVK